ncbi:adenylate kinase 7-like [Histomonas meleagridis]|uniref:adenylate kinase 7-like n=1 Tax=Histomonas meleagridis TaxID=135588 RepID=UPI00355A905D|nr:adenylate kinase 7-like [Histomonas meleagridis]KAH0801302.1 adenylate kinase 7-like [Histomonas meleagridis]
MENSAFVNYGNSREGKAIADALKEEGYFVYATRKPDPQKLDQLQPDPLSVDQFIDSDINTIVETMKVCRLIIYTILDTPKYAVQALTKLNESPGLKKVIIIISPILTWAGEPKAEDWRKRWAHPKYTDQLAAERFLTTSLQLRIYVMCVGLLYGDGEDVLLPLFRSAWHLKPVPVLEENRNIIPMLHVRDMAHGAVALSQTRPNAPVIIAHDGSGITQRDLVRSINKVFGAGRTYKKPENEVLEQLGRETIDWLKLDIDLEATEYNSLEFERHCENAIDDIQILVDEFVINRLLSPLKILAINIPTDLLQQIVKYYEIEEGTIDRMNYEVESYKGEEVLSLKELQNNDNNNEEEEREIPITEIMKFVLTYSPSFKNHGFVITNDLIPNDIEEKEKLFINEDEPTIFMPKYVITSAKKFGEMEKWFISKGSHCATIRSLDDAQKFFGLPRNFTRNVKILEKRKVLEQIEREKEEEERKRIKIQKEEEEKRKQEMIKRDQKILKEVDEELDSMKEVREMPAREFLMKYVVPMFIKPLEQINEARPDEPLRFLITHFEKEAEKSD